MDNPPALVHCPSFSVGSPLSKFTNQKCELQDEEEAKT